MLWITTASARYMWKMAIRIVSTWKMMPAGLRQRMMLALRNLSGWLRR